MPAEALSFTVNFENIDKNSISSIDEIISDVGFHPASGPMAGGDFTNSLNYQPFEDTEENRQLIERCVDKISDEFPDAGVEHQIRYNKDRGAIIQQRCEITIKNREKGHTTSDSTNNTTEDSDDPKWREFADSNDREKKRVGGSHARFDDDSASTDSDNDTEQKESEEPSGPPDNCIDCDSQDIESAPGESEQFICSDCGLVMNKRNTETRSNFLDEEDRSEYIRARWSEQTDTATVGIITEPYRRNHEYYRIENPREFFKDCSGEREEKRKIKQSDLEPFETLDLPPIDWRFTD